MEVTTVILIIAVAALIPISGYLFFQLGKKGIDAGKAISTAKTATEIADHVFDTIKPILPSTTAVALLDSVFNGAVCAAGKVEDLYKTSQIDKDERKIKAAEMVYDALKIAGISVTPEIDRLISGAIDGAVAFLPKTHDESGNISK